jgi:3-phosphoglycerate kinase
MSEVDLPEELDVTPKPSLPRTNIIGKHHINTQLSLNMEFLDKYKFWIIGGCILIIFLCILSMLIYRNVKNTPKSEEQIKPIQEENKVQQAPIQSENKPSVPKQEEPKDTFLEDAQKRFDSNRREIAPSSIIKPVGSDPFGTDAMFKNRADKLNAKISSMDSVGITKTEQNPGVIEIL